MISWPQDAGGVWASKIIPRMKSVGRRTDYHNKEWADKMEEIGLISSDTGAPGGKRTGQHMTHYIIPGGKYEQAFDVMLQEYALSFTLLEGDLMRSLVTGGAGSGGKSREKTKYTCPGCGFLWGKPILNLLCGDCNDTMQPVGGVLQAASGFSDSRF